MKEFLENTAKPFLENTAKPFLKKNKKTLITIAISFAVGFYFGQNYYENKLRESLFDTDSFLRGFKRK